TQKNSCLVCQQRKVKCDRTVPCSNCRKSEKRCEYKAPLPPKRRSRKAPELGLHARVRRYEQLLTKFGVKIEDVAAAGDDEGDPMRDISPEPGAIGILSGAGIDREGGDKEDDTQAENGRIIVTRSGSTRYLESSLWRDIDDELRDPEAIAQVHSSDEEQLAGIPGKSEGFRPAPSDSAHFILGGIDKNVDVDSLLPSVEVAKRLWHVFQENVDPLCKLFHAPTTEKILFENAEQRKDGRLSKNARALAFSIFTFAVTSMTNEECEQAAGEPRATLLARFREGTQASLVKACILRTSDIIVLQAYTLFLMAVRQYYDARSLWILSGTALRIAQRMGVHKDGIGSELTPFQIEIRRRLWWQIVVLDRTTAEISGAGTFASNYSWDSRVPLNVNDCDLDPDMKDFPKEREGATEMIFCLMRYELGDFFRNIKYLQAPDTTDTPWKKLGSKMVPMEEKDKAIEELQRRFEQKYLRYCDPLNKLHYLVSVVARSIIAMLFMITHHPRQYPDKGASMPQEEKDRIFEKALKIIEYGNLLQSSPVTRGFLWHMNVFFTWQALIFLVDHLVNMPIGPNSDKAWKQVELVYGHHPALITERSNTLHAAVRRLTLRAWEGREK
ncbi:hypothetical protein NA57DRAFT_9916, partial [Rhizodiscina lignyota]